MADPIITNVDQGSCILETGEFRDELLTFGIGGGTMVDGTILARNSVTKKYVAFVKGSGTNDLGIPKAILTYDVTLAAAGDAAVRVAVSGKFRKERLVIVADGDDSNIDADVIDALRNYGLVAVDTQELNIPDNS